MKLDDYEFRNISTELEDFKDDLKTIINFGKLPIQVVNTVPDWTARNGESVFYSDGIDQRQYFYLDNEWKKISFKGQWVGAWAIFSATNGIVIYDSFNVGAITRNGNGDYTLTWDRPFLSENYVLTGCGLDRNGTAITASDGTLIDVLESDPPSTIDQGPQKKSARIFFGSFSGTSSTDPDAHLLHVMTVGNI